MWGIQRSPVSSPHKVQWRGTLMLSLICAWRNGWENNRTAGDLRRHRLHYDVTIRRIMNTIIFVYGFPDDWWVMWKINPYPDYINDCKSRWFVLGTVSGPRSVGMHGCNGVTVTRSFDVLFDLRLNKRLSTSRSHENYWPITLQSWTILRIS